MNRLIGKVAIVTGGSRGVGKALCLALAREGADIVVAAKTDAPNPSLPGTIQETAQEIIALGRRALPVRVNVREEDDIERMAAMAAKELGRIDILVNNAGAIHIADLASTPAKKFDLVMGVNARAAFLCSRAVAPHMKSGGHIVMMSPPIRQLEKASGKVAYALSKLGMTMIAIGLAQELRDRKISVNAIWPVTAVESQATIHWKLGTPEQWRKPDVLADAVVEMVSTPPGELTGQALYDEEMLARAGITDLDRYAMVPGTKPPPLSKLFFDD